MKRSIFFSVVLAGMLLIPKGLNAQAFYSCDRWAGFSNGGYEIWNNIWGEGYGSQCIWANTYRDWGVNANHPNTGGIKSYPSVQRVLNVRLDQLSSATSSFNVTVPNSGTYNTAYDIWADNYRYEIMIWMNKRGAIGPFAHAWDGNGNPVPQVSNVSVGGHTFNVYRGDISAGHTVISFVRTSNTNSGTVNIKAILDWIRSRGWYGNVNVQTIEFGWEIVSSSGGLDFRVNDFSVSYNTGSTPPPSGTYYRLSNRGTSLYLDGMGRTSNGSDIGQWANTNHQNAQWVIETVSGNYVKLRNRATGLYVDGMGRTSNGSNVGQWANSSSYNQQWERISVSGGYYQFRNRATGLYLDGMGRTSNGSECGQWANTNHNNSHWSLSSTSSAEIEGALNAAKIEAKISVYPNPVIDGRVKVELSGIDGTSSIRIINLGGKLIKEEQVRGAGIYEINIDVKSGLYILQVINKEHVFLEKISIR